MKHFKIFTDQNQYQSYIENNWVSPHVYKIQQNKQIDYEERYVPLEYISSTQTGGQYIDLDCNLFQNTDDIIIDIKFNMKGGGKDYNETSVVNQTKPSVLIGSISEADPYYGFVVRKADIGSSGTVNDTYVTMYTKWQISNSVEKNANGDANNKKKWYPTYLAGNISGYENTRTGIVYEKRLIIDNLATKVTQINMQHMSTMPTYMFAIYCDAPASANNNYRNKMWRFSESDVYYCKITKGTTVIRDLIPVLNKQNIPGLYDKVNRKFYKSQGDTNFVAGPIKS